MKTTHSFPLLILAMGLLTATPAGAALAGHGIKPLKSVEFTALRTDGLARETWQDPYLVAARSTAAPTWYYVEDSEILNEGRNNTGGRKTTVNHQILYVTQFALSPTDPPVPVPVKGQIYIWQEATQANGDQYWTAIEGEVDFATGIATGTWTTYVENNPESEITGSGEFTAVPRPDRGERFYETTATGWVLTEGTFKKR